MSLVRREQSRKQCKRVLASVSGVAQEDSSGLEVASNPSAFDARAIFSLCLGRSPSNRGKNHDTGTKIRFFQTGPCYCFA